MFPCNNNPPEFKKHQSFLLYDPNPFSPNFFDLPITYIPSDQTNPTKQKEVPRKRSGKKDRHSKISTAQGVRDRRMRLSLQVARKFFDLQDMLGYDKASKTIEWLFCKSKKAIKELALSMSDRNTESLVSECEVVSGVEENSNANPKKKKANAREARTRARARARFRTREKMMSKVGLGGSCEAPDYSPDVGTIEKLLLGTSCSAPDDANNLMGFLGNWDVSPPGNSSSIYCTPDFPFFLPT